jgi:outer membrane protein
MRKPLALPTLLACASVLVLPLVARARQAAAPLPAAPGGAPVQVSASATGAVAGATLTRRQAEDAALRNNPRISVSALLALVQRQVVRETRSGEFPTLNGNVTGVGAVEGSRLSSGTLSAPRLLNHVGGGVEFAQLITDFGHTHHLVQSSWLQAAAADADAQATREDIVLATDLAFYNALEAQATLQVAQGTQRARQDVSDQVSALTASKLKSTLDQSFAQVNLSQAQLLVLDSENEANAAMARLNELLGGSGLEQYALVDDPTAPLPDLPTSPEALIALALQQRPDLQAINLTQRAEQSYSLAQREQKLPTVSALGEVGGTPVGSSTYFTPDWYGAVGVNVKIPIFNGFRFSAEAAEADLRAKASGERARDLRNRIARDVRTTWLTANTARQRMSVTSALVTQADTALDFAQTRYQLGLSSIVELSQAQLQQTQAHIEDANARFTYQADIAALRFQTASQP